MVHTMKKLLVLMIFFPSFAFAVTWQNAGSWYPSTNDYCSAKGVIEVNANRAVNYKCIENPTNYWTLYTTMDNPCADGENYNQETYECEVPPPPEDCAAQAGKPAGTISYSDLNAPPACSGDCGIASTGVGVGVGDPITWTSKFIFTGAACSASSGGTGNATGDGQPVNEGGSTGGGANGSGSGDGGEGGEGGGDGGAPNYGTGVGTDGSQTGEGTSDEGTDQGSATSSGTCAAKPVCTGDDPQECAMLVQQWYLMCPGTTIETSLPKGFDNTRSSEQLTKAKQEYQTKINEIKTNLEGVFSFTIGSGGTINQNNVETGWGIVDISWFKFRDQLSIIGAIIIAMAYISAFMIIMRD